MSQLRLMMMRLISISMTKWMPKSDSDSDDSDSSSGEVTRDNVIDKVESYEGHTLDTDTYTYKEPEKQMMVNGASHLLTKTEI